MTMREREPVVHPSAVTRTASIECEGDVDDETDASQSLPNQRIQIPDPRMKTYSSRDVLYGAGSAVPLLLVGVKGQDEELKLDGDFA